MYLTASTPQEPKPENSGRSRTPYSQQGGKELLASCAVNSMEEPGVIFFSMFGKCKGLGIGSVKIGAMDYMVE